jgi:phosphoribosylglycinamide formyltransferase-1
MSHPPDTTPHRIAIFASGNGSNALRLMQWFNAEQHPQARVQLVVCNRPEAGVVSKAQAYGVPVHLTTRQEMYQSQHLLEVLRNHEITWLILAGFLWLIPSYLLDAYPRRVINLHPALLPLYGGKGMYGMRVHEAVKAAGEKHTGITIHYANERYDEGDIIFQATCVISPDDSAEAIAQKIHALEHEHLPKVVEQLIAKSEQH